MGGVPAVTGFRQIDGYWIREADVAQELPDRIICTNGKTIRKPAPKGQP